MRKPALTAIAILTMIGAAQAIDFPAMKEGLWRVHVVELMDNSKTASDSDYSLCRSHAYDEQVKATMKKFEGMCTYTSDSTVGNKRSINSTCKVAGATTITTKGTVTTISDNDIRSEEDATYSPAYMGMTHETRVMEQTYKGSCPAGVLPGDRIMADGTVQHHSRR